MPQIFGVRVTDPEGVAVVEHIRFGGPYPGFGLRRPFPDDFNWRDGETLSLVLETSSGPFASSTPLSEALQNSDEYSEDVYYFERAGWLDATGIAANDGETILAACTPDPARQ